MTDDGNSDSKPTPFLPNPNLVEDGKNTRFNGVTAVSAGKRSQEVQKEKKRKEQDAQLLIRTILNLPLTNAHKTTDIDDIQSLNELKKATNPTVLTDAITEIIQVFKDDKTSASTKLFALKSLFEMAGMMPATKADVSVEGINEISFNVIKSPKEDIDKIYPDIQRICKQQEIDPGEKEDFEDLKEY